MTSSVAFSTIGRLVKGIKVYGYDTRNSSVLVLKNVCFTCIHYQIKIEVYVVVFIYYQIKKSYVFFYAACVVIK